MRSLSFAAAFSIFVMACASGDALREEGFSASPAGNRTWWVSYERESMSAERAGDALLYNTARLVLDSGGVWFTFEKAKPESRFDRERSSAVVDDPSLGDPTRESYRTGTSLQRVTSVSAIVEIVDGPGNGVLDASRVLEELTAKYGS